MKVDSSFRRWLVLVGSTVVLCGIGFTRVQAAPAAPTPQPAPGGSVALPSPSVPSNSSRLPTGVAAIPRTQTGVPAFVARGALDYVAAHPHPDRVRSQGVPAVQSVEFLTSAEVWARIGVKTELQPADMVCIVTSHGSFLVAGPQGMSRSGTVGYQIFDARTGNLVIEGVGS